MCNNLSSPGGFLAGSLCFADTLKLTKKDEKKKLKSSASLPHLPVGTTVLGLSKYEQQRTV